MPAIRVTNPNNSDRGAIIYINLVSIVPLNEKGDNKYVFEISTRARDKDGNLIDKIFVYDTSVNGLLKALPKAVASICDKIYWGDIREDTKHPVVEYYGPTGINVSLFSSVTVGIADKFPSNGIDMNSITMSVNGFDVTNDLIIQGTYNKVNVSWSPKRRVTNG